MNTYMHFYILWEFTYILLHIYHTKDVWGKKKDLRKVKNTHFVPSTFFIKSYFLWEKYTRNNVLELLSYVYFVTCLVFGVGKKLLLMWTWYAFICGYTLHYLAPHIKLHWDCFVWQEVAQCLLLFQFAVIPCPLILFQCIKLNVRFVVTMFKGGTGNFSFSSETCLTQSKHIAYCTLKLRW